MHRFVSLSIYLLLCVAALNSMATDNDSSDKSPSPKNSIADTQQPTSASEKEMATKADSTDLLVETEVKPKLKLKPKPKRIFIVNSYHPEDPWSEQTQTGLWAALQQADYVNKGKDLLDFNLLNQLSTPKVLLQRVWLYSRRADPMSLSATASRVLQQIDDFKPDLIFLGEDEAVSSLVMNLPKSIPVVFWGINADPLRYDVLDSLDKPGQQVTGTYQTGYLPDGVFLLQQLLPQIKKLAVISDNSISGRALVKQLAVWEQQQVIPLPIIDYVHTNDYALWQQQVLALQQKVDAFILLDYHALRNQQGEIVKSATVLEWYLHKVRIPEVANSAVDVQAGLFCATDDSAYQQAYQAGQQALAILTQGQSPAELAVRTPPRGKRWVNLTRQQQLQLNLRNRQIIEVLTPN